MCRVTLKLILQQDFSLTRHVLRSMYLSIAEMSKRFRGRFTDIEGKL